MLNENIPSGAEYRAWYFLDAREKLVEYKSQDILNIHTELKSSLGKKLKAFSSLDPRHTFHNQEILSGIV